MTGDSQWKNEGGTTVGIVLALHRPDPDFLKIQIDSIFAQTFENWKLWIVPDGSEHGIHLALLENLAKDPRVEILDGGEHTGSCRTFERGLAALPECLDFIALSDQDDEWHPSKLEKLSSFLTAAPGIAMAFCDSSVIDRSGREIAKSVREYEERPSRLTTVPLLARNTVSGHAMLFRRSLLARALPFPRPVFESGMNHDYWLALAASVSGGIRFLDETLVSYRLHEGNEVGPRARGTSVPERRSWWEQNQRLLHAITIRMAAISGDQITWSRKHPRIAMCGFAARSLGTGNLRAAGIFLRAAIA